MGQDQVSGGVSVLFWIAASLQCSMGTSRKLVIRSKSAIRSSSVINWCNIWSIEGVAVYGHVQECHVTFVRERDFIMFDDIPISIIKLSEGRFQTFPEISLSEELRWMSRRPKNKTFWTGASPGIPYELWDKKIIDWRRSNIATQERIVCNIEVEIVTFVVKGSAQLTVPLDGQE